MKIVLKAAQRLVCANADETKARDFLKSVADVTVGRLEYTAPGVMRFGLASPQEFMNARKALTERYGKMDVSGVPRGSHAGKWKIADKHHVLLSDQKANTVGHQYSLTLMDESHKESSGEMIRRIIGPPKNIAPK